MFIVPIIIKAQVFFLYSHAFAHKMNKATLYLLIVLIMLPQIVETIYSPALPSLAQAFNVAPHAIAQTLSLYFVGFAFGVLLWGILSDYIGRKPVLLLGLMLYSLASCAMLYVENFYLLLLLRCCTGFAIAVGSVITQTMFRDQLSPAQMIPIFSIVGVFIAISPSIGLFLGGVLTQWHGYVAVFYFLAISSGLLCIVTAVLSTETLSQKPTPPPIVKVVKQLLSDRKVIGYAALITGYNLLIFSYYLKSPFLFVQHPTALTWLPYTGILFSIGALLGVMLNRYCLNHTQLKWVQLNSKQLLLMSALICLAASGLSFKLANSAYFFVPMILLMLAYSMAIPILLAQALSHYVNYKGIAGAVLGFIYYIAIGLLLEALKWLPNLSLIFSSVSVALLLIMCLMLKKKCL